MKRSVWKGILLFVLLIVVGAALSIVASLIGSDYLRCLAIVLPASLAGYLFTCLFSKDNNVTTFSDRKRWWGFAAGILTVTTLFWLFEKFIF